MSLIPKLGTVVSVALVLASIGTTSLNAQTPVENSSTITVATAASTDAPKAAASTDAPKAIDSKKSDVTVNVDTTSVTVSTATAKSTSSPETTVPQTVDQDKWQFVFSPYFWMSGLHGTTGGPNRTVHVDESFGDIFESLKFAFMGVFEAHKNKWAIQTDVEFVSLEDEKATPGPLFSSATAKIKTFVFTPEAGYKIYSDPDKGSFVQVLGGTRIWHISADLNFNAGLLPAVQLKNSRSWVDGVVGMRGRAALSEKFFVMGRFDVGGGGSKFTYQLFGGLGYNLNKKVALIGGYRALDVNYDKNNFIYDTNQRGPIVGLGFRF